MPDPHSHLRPRPTTGYIVSPVLVSIHFGFVVPSNSSAHNHTTKKKRCSTIARSSPSSAPSHAKVALVTLVH
ncbi:hypothetical protein CC80DRAFT_497978 [Byssothecium circinans]|uniref:Uncharacterized protein n=1 Tax=Byssothecium circinans TaxID=147558 RepID=A0A6A5TAL7_9PLEO|nr:hypothetical protein CC80DRAFT_497978 [Byssothecium circinans]